MENMGFVRDGQQRHFLRDPTNESGFGILLHHKVPKRRIIGLWFWTLVDRDEISLRQTLLRRILLSNSVVQLSIIESPTRVVNHVMLVINALS